MDEGLEASEGWHRCIESIASLPSMEDSGESTGGEPPELDEEVLTELAALAIELAPRRLLARFKEVARADRLTFEEMLFDRIRPVAQRLGDCWLEDTLSFGEVTVGAAALQRVVAALGDDAEGPLTHRELVVLTAAPGEQHVLPIHMLSEAIRADGWATHLEPQMDLEDILDLVSIEEVAVVGITCKDPERLGNLASFAAAIQEASIIPVDLVIGGSPELEIMMQESGFTYLPTGRAFCRRLARRGAI